MNITKSLTIDLANRSFPKTVNCKQYDANTRFIAITLTNNGNAFTMPANPIFMVACRKPDGSRILYDTIINATPSMGLKIEVDAAAWSATGLSSATFTYDGSAWKLSGSAVDLADYGITITDGTPNSGNTIVISSSAACSNSSNTVTVAIAPECLTDYGNAQLDLFVLDGEEQLGVWSVYLFIEETSTNPQDALSSAAIPVISASIKAFVYDWLDDHPEATTTVTDGSITNAKLSNSFASPGVATEWVYNSGSGTGSTCKAGEYFFHNKVLYKASVDINTPEAWTAAHWTAAVLGDDVSEIKDALGYETINTVLTTDDFEQNGIYAVTGGNSNAANRIKTKNYITTKPAYFTVSDGFAATLFGWNGSTYVGMWSTNGFAKSTTYAVLISGTFALPDYATNGYDRFKIVIRKSDNTNLTPTDGNGSVTLSNVSYSKVNEIDNNKDRLDAVELEVEIIEDAIGFAINIANPANLIAGSVWSGVNTVYTASGYSRQEINVEPETEYTASQFMSSFSWFTNDVLENLGNITQNPFTTPAGCTKIRLGHSGAANFVVVKANLSTIPTYDDYPYDVVKTDMDGIKTKITQITKKNNYTSLSVFSSIGAIGDSYSSGGIYGVTGVQDGAHYDVSWVQILGRKCGFNAFNYSKGAIDVSAWLSDENYGLPKLLSDPARQLYVITLGINAEKQIADPTQNAEVGTTADINLTDPTQNADTFCGHYGRMLSGIIDHAPNAKIILVRPLLTSQAKLTAISNIGELFGVPVISMASDWYYATDFYTDNLSTSHPIALTYGGMALAFERQIRECMIDNVNYFLDLT